MKHRARNHNPTSSFVTTNAIVKLYHLKIGLRYCTHKALLCAVTEPDFRYDLPVFRTMLHKQQYHRHLVVAKLFKMRANSRRTDSQYFLHVGSYAENTIVIVDLKITSKLNRRTFRPWHFSGFLNEYIIKHNNQPIYINDSYRITRLVNSFYTKPILSRQNSSFSIFHSGGRNNNRNDQNLPFEATFEGFYYFSLVIFRSL